MIVVITEYIICRLKKKKAIKCMEFKEIVNVVVQYTFTTSVC